MGDPNLTIDLDFTGINPALGSGLGFLEAGYHTGTIDDIKLYDMQGGACVLYVYLVTGDVRHREKFDLAAGKAFILALLISAGVDPSKIVGKKARIPFDKLVGKETYFQYTPPRFDEAGRKVEKSYPKYRFYTKDQYQKVVGNGAGASPVEDLDLENVAGAGSAEEPEAEPEATPALRRTRRAPRSAPPAETPPTVQATPPAPPAGPAIPEDPTSPAPADDFAWMDEG